MSLDARRFGIAAFALALGSITAHAADVVRYPLPNGSKFPIAAAVEVPAGKTLIILSGMVAPVSKTDAPKDSTAAYGSTETQTVGVLKTMQKQLEGLHLGMGDIVSMHVFLVGDPALGGKMDFEGFMRGYTQFFGTPEQPKLPARAAMQVAALANPGFLVEIEATAVRP